MRIDFYHLTDKPLEQVLPAICEKLLAGGERLLVVAGEGQVESLDRLLWTYAPESFLPLGRAGAAREAEQPILIGASPTAANGARNVALNSYKLGGNRAHHYIRSLPNNQATAHKGVNLGNDRWHTFAVEVRKKRISWFVDAHVISTENRPEALSDVPYTVRFTMLAPNADKRMNRSRMQMDWLRYFTLRKPNSKSVKAPLPRSGSYADAC